MIWLAWRQFRTQAVVAVVLLGALVATLLATGPSLVHLFDSTVLTCKRLHDCQGAMRNFNGKDSLIRRVANALVIVTPALVGVFWGAPLVARELETGTFRLSWTQSVMRSRWLLVKLGLVGAASMAAAGLVSLAVTWWSSPFDGLADMPFNAFDTRGIVPIGYAAFAFALGVTAGVVYRRTIPAMATTFFAFFAVRLAFSDLIRQRLLAPVRATAGFGFQLHSSSQSFERFGPPNPGDWLLTNQVVTGAGRAVALGTPELQGFFFQPLRSGGVVLQGIGRCPNPFPGAFRAAGSPSPATLAAMRTCVASFHMHEVLTYQPPSRYWTLQALELGIFLGLAALLAAGGLWWVRRRLT